MSAPRPRTHHTLGAGGAGLLCLLALCAPLSHVTPAWAQAAAAPDAASVKRADAAFDEGRELFDQGRFKEACEKFELSMQLDPSPGTLLNLGNCYEPQGDLVKALATFERAFEDAQRAPDGKRRELWTNAARERIAALSARVAELTVRGAPERAEVTLDGAPFEAGRPLRVNPGRHALHVSAPDRRPYDQTLDIAVGQHLGVEVPELEPLVAETRPELSAPPVEPVAPPPAAARSFGPWPYVIGGGGVALLGASLVTGLMAKSKADELKQDCDGKSCSPDLEDVKDSAHTLGLTTDVLWITGALAVGTGVTLLLLETPGGDQPAATLGAGCFGAASPGGCGLIGSGRF